MTFRNERLKFKLKSDWYFVPLMIICVKIRPISSNFYQLSPCRLSEVSYFSKAIKMTKIVEKVKIYFDN